VTATDAPESRYCEVCGDPISPYNTYGVCSGRGKPKCIKARERIAISRRPPRTAVKRQLRKPDIERRYCEVCGDPLRCDNQTGICCSRKRPDCIKARKRRVRAAIPPPPPVVIIKAGDKFGRWTALEDYTPDSRRILVRCECGTQRRLPGAVVASGGSLSCGCSRKGPRQNKPPYLTAGTTAGRLTVLEDVARMSDPAPCRCECGNDTAPRAGNIKNGITGSCGCLSRERTTTHGFSKHALYSIWNNIIDRCTNPNAQSWGNYGGREDAQVTVCDRWRVDPWAFAEDIYREIGPRPEGKNGKGRALYELDRIDNDRGYWCGHCPYCSSRGQFTINVRWSDKKTQLANRRTMAELSKKLAVAVARAERAETSRPRRAPRAPSATLVSDPLFSESDIRQ
jgi:hypothetical protein